MDITAHLLIETGNLHRRTLTLYNYSLNEPTPKELTLRRIYHSFAIEEDTGARTHLNEDGTYRVEIDTFPNGKTYGGSYGDRWLLQLTPPRFTTLTFELARLAEKRKVHTAKVTKDS